MVRHDASVRQHRSLMLRSYYSGRAYAKKFMSDHDYSDAELERAIVSCLGQCSGSSDYSSSAVFAGELVAYEQEKMRRHQ